MLKNEDIICISSIDWDFIWQGHQEIMTRFARNGNRILFIENTGARVPGFRDLKRIKNRIANWRKGIYGIRKIENDLYVYSPLILPFPYLKIARFINKRIIFSVLFRWLKAVGFREPVFWVFLPTGLSLDLINAIEPKVVVYYCIDSFQASSKDAGKIKKTELQMIKKSDLVFATSEELLSYCKRHNKRAHYFPFAVNIENFQRVLNEKNTTPSDMKNMKRPIAGYVGGVHKWIDFELIKNAAVKNRNISFVFCGPIQTDVAGAGALPNVFFLGQKGPNELPSYVKEFDLALIPYRITEYTRNVYPTKLNEYLSLGKTVISTNLPEINKFNKENGNIVKIAENNDDFAGYVAESAGKPADAGDKTLAMQIAAKNSWAKRIERMSSLIEEAAGRKNMEKEKSWKDNLSRLYRTSRRKAVPVVVALALFYLLVFYTPLLWLLAGPLKISDTTPRAADAIVVLGGGVGESGRPGQGHEERVDSAVRLYREGFADKIVYSSGYRHIMKEARVMKALSVFLGVDERDIILDELPVNTYEMVADLKKILTEKGWKKVILISSSYHMRRLKLLCDRGLGNTTVYFIPVEKSSFYRRGRRVQMRQIKGIIHEYLAILYYKLKGYV